MSEEHLANTRSTGIVSIAIMCSRVLGLVREMVFAALYGGSKWMDCFMMAFRTPNMLRDLFAEGALSTAFVTTFSKKIKNEGDTSAWQLAYKMATLTTIFMSFLSLIGILLAPVIIRVLAYGWTNDEEQIQFTVLLAQIMYPFIAIISLSALVMGMLNAKKVFGIPALASSFFNLGSIIGGGLIGWWIDPSFGKNALIGFALGTLIGGLSQLGIQLPALMKVGFRFVFDFRWKDSGVKKILQLMWPALIAGSAIQVNVMVNSFFASFLEYGSVSWLQWSFRLFQLPLGVFGVAVAMVTLPSVSRLAAQGMSEEFGEVLAKSMRLVFFLTLPCAVGLILLAEPIISLIFERGAFDAQDRVNTAYSLQTYALGLIFYAGSKVLSPAFYAIEKRFVPMLISFFSIGTNIVLNAFFLFYLHKGHAFLALSTSIGAFLNFSILYFLMGRYTKKWEVKKLTRVLCKLSISAALLGVVCWGMRIAFLTGFAEFSLIYKMFTLFSTITLAALSYFILAWFLKIEEVEDFVKSVKERLGN